MHKELMLKCFMTFFMQVMLSYLVRFNSDGLSAAYLGDVPLNAARIICAMILHISIMPEVACSISLLKFAKYNPEAFYGSNLYPFLICCMKLLGGLQTEWSNVMLMVESQAIEDVVKDFIALGIIAEIDDLMVSSV